MPVIHDNQLTTLRSQHPHTARVEWFLAVAPYGDAIFHAQAVGGARSDREIHFDTITQGDVTSVEAGMTLWVDDSEHDAYNLGCIRVRGLIIHYINGATEFTRGEILTGAASGHTGIVVSWMLTGGTWAGGNAAGDVYVTNVTGTFQAAENLNGSVGGANMATCTLPIDSMQVAENDHIVWANDAYLTLPGAYGFRELWGKYPRLTEVGGVVNFLMDYDDDFSSPQDTALPPKANAGPPAVAWLDGGNADVSFNGDASYPTEVGGAIVGWAWDFADGAVIDGPGEDAAGTCDDPNVVQFNAAGFRYVSLTVTDDSVPARQATVYVPVWIFDEGTEDPFKLAEISSQDGDTSNGWRLALKAFRTNTAAEDIIYRWPDGALVVLFTRTWFGSAAEGGVGGWCMADDKHYRDNIRFVGWLLGETLKHDFAAGTVEFEAVAHDGIMRLIPGWPFTIEDTTGPTDWYEVADLNVDRALHYLLENYSTVNQVCHVERVGEEDARPVKMQSYSGASLYDQAQGDLLGDAKCLLLSDRQGILYATQDPQFMAAGAGGRGDVDVACHLQQVNPNGQADWLNEIDETKPHRPAVGMVRVGGFAFDEPLLARAPGAAPVQQANEQRVDGLIFINQDEADLWAGLTLTLANLDYPQIPLELVGYWPVFDPAYQEYVKLTVTDPMERRDWAAQDFVVRQVSFDDRIKDGTSITSLVLEKASQILTGEIVTIPSEVVPAPPLPPPSPLPTPSPPPTGPVKAAVAWTHDQIGYTSDLLRHHVDSVATAGTGGGGGLDLFDTAVDFVDLGIGIGDTVENMATYALTTVAAVVSANHLTLNADIGLAPGSAYHICGVQWTDVTPGLGGSEVVLDIFYGWSGSTCGLWCLTNERVLYASNAFAPALAEVLALATVQAHHGDLLAAEFVGFCGYVANPGYCCVALSNTTADSGFGTVYHNNYGVGAWSYGAHPVGNGGDQCGAKGICRDPVDGMLYHPRFGIGFPGPINRLRLQVSANGGANWAWTDGDMASWRWPDARYDIYKCYSGGDIQAAGRTNPALPDDESPKHSGTGAVWTTHVAAGYQQPGAGDKAGMTGWYGDAGNLVTMWEEVAAPNHFCLLRTLNGGGAWTEIGDANVVFDWVPGGFGGSIALPTQVWDSDEDTILWVGLCLGAPDNVRIRYTDVAGGPAAGTWFNKMGDWYTVFAGWSGASGSSGCRGNCGCLALPRVGANA